MQPKLHDKPQSSIAHTTDYQQITHSLNNTESRFSVIPACSQKNVTGRAFFDGRKGVRKIRRK